METTRQRWIAQRRATLAAMAAAFLAGPRLVWPQNVAMRQVGILAGGTVEDTSFVDQRIVAELAKFGWIEGRTLQLRRVYADRQIERLPGLATELARSGVDVIMTGASATTLAAARATRTVPIVFTSVHYPVEQGLVRSLAKPGGNVTGPLLFPSIETTFKRLEFLRALAPAARRLAWIWPADLFDLERVDGSRYDTRPALTQAAHALDFESRMVAVPPGQPVATVFDRIVEARTQAISAAVHGAPEPITKFALEHRIPSGYPMRYFTAAGGLFSYGPTAVDLGAAVTLATRYVDSILRGAKPADLPVEVPSRYELVVNAKTAQALGIRVPPTVQMRVDETIE